MVSMTQRPAAGGTLSAAKRCPPQLVQPKHLVRRQPRRHRLPVQPQADLLEAHAILHGRRRLRGQKGDLLPSCAGRQVGKGEGRCRLTLALTKDHRSKVVPVHPAALQGLTDSSRRRHHLAGLIAGQQRQQLGQPIRTGMPPMSAGIRRHAECGR